MPEHLRRFGRVSESVSSSDREDFESIDDSETELHSLDSELDDEEELEDVDDGDGSRRLFRFLLLTGFFFLISMYFFGVFCFLLDLVLFVSDSDEKLSEESSVKLSHLVFFLRQIWFVLQGVVSTPSSFLTFASKLLPFSLTSKICLKSVSGTTLALMPASE